MFLHKPLPGHGGLRGALNGGGFGAELCQSGFDLLRVTGAADDLSVLLIDDGETRILPMLELAGKTSLETEGLVKKALGTHEVNVATIGPAGENLVRFARVNAAGILPSYNFKDAGFARIAQINGDTMLDSYKIGDSARFSCPMGPCG